MVAPLAMEAHGYDPCGGCEPIPTQPRAHTRHTRVPRLPSRALSLGLTGVEGRVVACQVTIEWAMVAHLAMEAHGYDPCGGCEPIPTQP
jgi:hypothetical protein